MPKRFPTMIALVRFHSSVYSLMDRKMYSLAKGFPTFLTFIGFFISMNSLVIKKEVLLPEILCTFIIFIGFFTSMNFLIKCKGCLLVESSHVFMIDYHLTHMSTWTSLLSVKLASALPIILETRALKTTTCKVFHYLPLG